MSPTKTIKIVALICFSITLPACYKASMPYMLKSNTPTAKLRFKLEDPNHYGMVHTKTRSCKKLHTLGQIGAPYFVDIKTRTGGVTEMIGSLGKPEPSVYEVQIEAEKPFAALYTQMGPSNTLCAVSITFLPQANREYEIQYYDDYGDCYGLISELQYDEKGTIKKRRVNVITDPRKICPPHNY